MLTMSQRRKFTQDSPNATPEQCTQAQIAAICGGLDYLKTSGIVTSFVQQIALIPFRTSLANRSWHYWLNSQ